MSKIWLHQSRNQSNVKNVWPYWLIDLFLFGITCIDIPGNQFIWILLYFSFVLQEIHTFHQNYFFCRQVQPTHFHTFIQTTCSDLHVNATVLFHCLLVVFHDSSNHKELLVYVPVDRSVHYCTCWFTYLNSSEQQRSTSQLLYCAVQLLNCSSCSTTLLGYVHRDLPGNQFTCLTSCFFPRTCTCPVLVSLAFHLGLSLAQLFLLLPSGVKQFIPYFRETEWSTYPLT